MGIIREYISKERGMRRKRMRRKRDKREKGERDERARIRGGGDEKEG